MHSTHDPEAVFPADEASKDGQAPKREPVSPVVTSYLNAMGRIPLWDDHAAVRRSFHRVDDLVHNVVPRAFELPVFSAFIRRLVKEFFEGKNTAIDGIFAKGLASPTKEALEEFLGKLGALSQELDGLQNGTSHRRPALAKEADRLCKDLPFTAVFFRRIMLELGRRDFAAREAADRARLFGDSPEALHAVQHVVAAMIETRNAVINGNLRLVIPWAKRYRGRGVGFDELIAEGNDGLAEAWPRYDANSAASYATYATIWIRQRIFRALHARRVAGYPRNFVSLATKLGHVRRELQKEGIEPTEEALAKRMRCSTMAVKRFIEFTGSDVSLDAPEGVNDNRDRVERMSWNGEAPSARAESYRFGRAFTEFVASAGLTEREAKVLAYYYGFVDGRTWTLEEIGGVFSLTRERIRQIKEKALEKLRRNRQVWERFAEQGGNFANFFLREGG